MLAINTENRLTLDEILNHPWVLQSFQSEEKPVEE